jgi:hypothetical protein
MEPKKRPRPGLAEGWSRITWGLRRGGVWWGRRVGLGVGSGRLLLQSTHHLSLHKKQDPGPLPPQKAGRAAHLQQAPVLLGNVLRVLGLAGRRGQPQQLGLLALVGRGGGQRGEVVLVGGRREVGEAGEGVAEGDGAGKGLGQVAVVCWVGGVEAGQGDRSGWSVFLCHRASCSTSRRSAPPPSPRRSPSSRTHLAGLSLNTVSSGSPSSLAASSTSATPFCA